jgi:serine/threonine-protein kinase RsbW
VHLKQGATVEIMLPSQLGYEKVAMSTAASVAKLMGFTQDRIEDLKTALAEACINAIEHGNQQSDEFRVGVEMSVDDDKLEVKIVDEGTGMIKQPATPDIDRKMHGEEDARGMGMFLIQALVDEAEWVPSSPSNKSYARLVIRLNKEKV